MLTTKQISAGIVIGSLLLGGCTSKVANNTELSGFLSDYTHLQKVNSPSGQTVLRWVDPSVNSKQFTNLYYEPIKFYPTPKPTAQISQDTLNKVLSYTNQNIKSALGQRFTLVNSPKGANTLIFRGAITGVTTANEGLQFYEVIPVALVIAGTMAVTGNRSQDTQLFFEGQFINAATGKPVFEVVRKGFGKQLNNDSQKLTVEDLKKIVTDMASDITHYQ
ncbi:DUF3313 domain-containing protein [Pragia fontium]|uniref:DUF3313 domain-containing protein n=1 Tax=Pragia fontium DSM 5563 = ATCC 49100 TaxID=1122977 RepID=A0AAJ5BG03_9GAMM|nr:DUF3313 domain-containing protein [Pragia fontium]SFC11481.1 Protein of unknown function [Pragia fontium DSM 5563 = ATCC 49100]SUB81377.1 Protein of uncharacterised function (DUF3313) [Pragia fontium]VEJ53602.1 Protein of uncharacterised function (DUF3313) [Pragia fontium]